MHKSYLRGLVLLNYFIVMFHNQHLVIIISVGYKLTIYVTSEMFFIPQIQKQWMVLQYDKQATCILHTLYKHCQLEFLLSIQYLIKIQNST